MTYQELRRKYPRFVYEKFGYGIVNNNLEIKYYYSIPPDHLFTHKISFDNSQFITHYSQLEFLIFNLGLSLMPSYWKATCSPLIEISAGNLSADQIKFWEKLFTKGMGEYFYKNQIDSTGPDFLSITSSGPTLGTEPLALSTDKNKVLVPVGGGKDSIVTLELLKPHFQITPFVINPVPIIQEVIATSDLADPVRVKSEIDPCLLELNKQGFLNGHVPVSAFYAFCALLASRLFKIPAIAFSDERSSDEGNVQYLGQTINHQYSKTLEFETDLNKYLLGLNLDLDCFSFLHPLYELQITKLFSKYPQYFKVFSSCNQNFKLTTHNSQLTTNLWCCHCPKCVSTALMLASFIGKEKVIEIMGVYPPDLPENKKILDELLGNSPTKPFECVLTRAEAKAAYTEEGLNDILSSWLDDPNMPEEFRRLLKSAL